MSPLSISFSMTGCKQETVDEVVAEQNVEEARAAATSRMIAQAAQMGADAIINVRYMTTSVVGTAAELFAYGTAVKLS